MPNKILITSDSTTDLGPELLERFNIKVLPLKVSLGENTYTDGVDVNPDKIYEHFKNTGELPKTAAPNLQDCIDFFKEYTDMGYSIVHFTLSSEMSSSFNNARLAAGEFENVHVVDTQNLSTGGGLMVISAAKMAENGDDASVIADKCRALSKKIDASFVLSDLEYLHKGGRCSGIAAFGANLLKLNPCIVVRNGKMDVSKKYRGKFLVVLKEYLSAMLADKDDIETDMVFVTHAGVDPDICNKCVAQVKELLPFKDVFLTRAGCTISSHCGPNTLGVLFIRKSDVK